MSPGLRQANIWTNAGILLIGPLGTNSSEIIIGIRTFWFKKIRLKMSSGKWQSFCLGLNAITVDSNSDTCHENVILDKLLVDKINLSCCFCGFIFRHDMSKEHIFSDFYVCFWFQYIFRHLMNIGMFLMYQVTSTMWMMIEFYHTNLKVSQYWFRYRFDATRHQATIWTIIYQDL